MSPINLTAEQKRFYVEKLETTLSSKKLFLREDFSLPDLAEETGIQLHILSYIINSEIKLNFKEYINLMRIEYFMEKINDPSWKDLTVENRTKTSGFRSRTTAHRAFLRHTGMTASEYLDTNRIDPGTRKKKRYNY